jgi:hypothetical protein
MSGGEWIQITGHGGIVSPEDDAPPQQWLDFATVLSVAALTDGKMAHVWNVSRWVGETADAYMAKWHAPRPMRPHDIGYARMIFDPPPIG